MALRNGRYSTEKKNAKNTQSDDIGQTEMGNHDSKGTIKFSSWTQSSSEVTIVLHSGRKLSERELSVTFTDKDVKVGLTDGRKWSCCFNQLVDKNCCRFQIKKLKIHLIAKKQKPDVHWSSYEKVEDEDLTPSLTESDCSTAPTRCFEVKKPATKSKSAVSTSEFNKLLIVPPVEKKTEQKNASPAARELRVESSSPVGFVGSGDEGVQKGDLKTEPDRVSGTGTPTLDEATVAPSPMQIDGESDELNLEDIRPDFASNGSTVEAVLDRPVSLNEDGPSVLMVSSVEESVVAMEPTGGLDCPAEVETEDLISSSASSSSAGASFDCEHQVFDQGASESQERTEETRPLLADQESESDDSSLPLDPSPDAEISSSTLLPPESSVTCELQTNVETHKPSEPDDIRDLTNVKSDFYERDTVVVVTMFAKQIKAETLRVLFSETEMVVNFQTSDPRFLQAHEGSTNETVFRWKVNLISTVVAEKCSYKVSGLNLVVTLTKKLNRRWGSLTVPPMMKSASTPQTTQNAWLPTCQQNGGNATPSTSTASQKTPSTVVFDELSDAPAKSSKPSTSGYFSSNQSIDSRKDLSGQNKPTCKVSPITNAHGDSTVSSSTMTTSSLPVVVARPGLMGLDNLGNTCFMNSVLQVLANTTELKDYFLDGSFQKELNHDNPLGMQGKLATAFGYLMKIIWTSNQRSFEPSQLKNLVAAKQTRFVGYSQHDAEEFMEFLLDGLHEDLNRIRKKPYFQDHDMAGKPDEVVANEAWKRHKMRNNSHIVDVFQGQYHSRIVCPTCDMVSITFDPFSIIQVPIPKKKKLVSVVFMSTIPSNKPIKYHVQIGVDATVDHLKDALYQRTRVHPANLRILEVSQSKIVSEFTKGSSLEKVSSSDMIVACAVLSEADYGEPVHEFSVVQRTLYPRTIPRVCSYCHRENDQKVSLKRCTSCYKTSYCDQDCQRKDWAKHKLLCALDGDPIGCPFIISIPHSKMTFSHLCSTIEACARYSVNAFQPPPQIRKTLSPRKSSSASSSSSVSSLSSSVSEQSSDAPEKSSTGDTYEPMFDAPSAGGEPGAENPDVPSSEEAIDRTSAAYASSEADSNLSQPPVRCVLATKQNAVPLPPPPFYLRPCTRQGTIVHGTQRLQDLGEGLLDVLSYRCLLVEWKNKEDCSPYVEVETKSLDFEESESNFTNGSSLDVNNSNVITLGDCLTLFTEPEVLHPDQTWYCPKCKVHCQATKELSLWRLPPTLIVHLKRFSFVGMLWRNKIDDFVDFPVTGLDMSRYVKRPLAVGESPPIYDLYGVINHMGDLLGGHYTSYARCPDPEDTSRSQFGWRLFDDSTVRPCSESQVVSRSAYVLFYRRRDASLQMMERNGRDISPLAGHIGNQDDPSTDAEGPAADENMVATDDLDDVRVEEDEDSEIEDRHGNEIDDRHGNEFEDCRDYKIEDRHGNEFEDRRGNEIDRHGNEFEDRLGSLIRIAEATTTTHVEETDIDSVD